MTNPADPSNRLLNNEITDFVEAMRAVREMCDREQRAAGTQDVSPAVERLKAAAIRCLGEYVQGIRAAEKRLVAQWQAAADADVVRIGECLEISDYTDLAM